MSNQDALGSTGRICINCRKTLVGVRGVSNSPDYYWRDYTGEIPADAVPGGRDINSKTTYIGQAFYPGYGLLVGTIRPGKAAMKVSLDTYVKVYEIGIKILCGNNLDSFVWEKADSISLHITTIGKHIVTGGFERDKIIYIGRAMYQSELIIGRIAEYDAENAKLYFVHGENEISVNSYQVLIINKNG